MTLNITEITVWKKIRTKMQASQVSLGFIPTMGALHQGHLSLIKKSLLENDKTIVSIFVNPTQFDESKDLETYPSDLENDFKLLAAMGVDYVFRPSVEEIYPGEMNYVVSEQKFSQALCGRSRNGHFDGVLTVVLKLFNLIQATRAYFGEKDFQQYKLVCQMCDVFFIDIKVILVPTVRDKNGLALSSRNKKLSKAALELAAKFYETLNNRELNNNQVVKVLKNIGFEVDYVEEILNRRFGAVRLEKVRLIDNIYLGVEHD